MQVSEIYKSTRNEKDCLDEIEKQIQALIDTNAENMQAIECLELSTTYFDNQNIVFNILMDAIIDLKIATSYTLLEIESQFREEAKEL